MKQEAEVNIKISDQPYGSMAFGVEKSLMEIFVMILQNPNLTAGELVERLDADVL